MTDKELRKLNRAELLQILIGLSEENEVLTRKNKDLEQRLADKTIHITHAGSIAEAALHLNRIFEDAQKAADQYLENVKHMHSAKDDEANMQQQPANATVQSEDL